MAGCGRLVQVVLVACPHTSPRTLPFNLQAFYPPIAAIMRAGDAPTCNNAIPALPSAQLPLPRIIPYTQRHINVARVSRRTAHRMVVNKHARTSFARATLCAHCAI